MYLMHLMRNKLNYMRVTYHTVTWYVARGDAEGGVFVVLVAVDGQFPVVNPAR